MQDGEDNTAWRDAFSLSYYLASNNSKHSLIVCASSLKGLSCIRYKKLRQNFGKASFNPMIVANEATLWRIILRYTYCNPRDV